MVLSAYSQSHARITIAPSPSSRTYAPVLSAIWSWRSTNVPERLTLSFRWICMQKSVSGRSDLTVSWSCSPQEESPVIRTKRMLMRFKGIRSSQKTLYHSERKVRRDSSRIYWQSASQFFHQATPWEYRLPQYLQRRTKWGLAGGNSL